MRFRAAGRSAPRSRAASSDRGKGSPATARTGATPTPATRMTRARRLPSARRHRATRCIAATTAGSTAHPSSRKRRRSLLLGGKRRRAATTPLRNAMVGAQPGRRTARLATGQIAGLAVISKALIAREVTGGRTRRVAGFLRSPACDMPEGARAEGPSCSATTTSAVSVRSTSRPVHVPERYRRAGLPPCSAAPVPLLARWLMRSRGLLPPGSTSPNLRCFRQSDRVSEGAASIPARYACRQQSCVVTATCSAPAVHSTSRRSGVTMNAHGTSAVTRALRATLPPSTTAATWQM